MCFPIKDRSHLEAPCLVVDKSLYVDMLDSTNILLVGQQMHQLPPNNGRNDDTFKYSQKDEEKQAQKYAANREMTSVQEVWNAITMIPYPLFFMFMIVTGSWLSEEDIHSMKEVMIFEQTMRTASNMTKVMPFIDNSCVQSSLFPTFHALPPAPVLLAAIGIITHTPCSILYHVLCAWYIPSGPKRIDHWSRRLDQAMIHFISTCWCYASSANLAYSFCALIINAYSAIQLFSQRAHKPKQVIGRIAISLLLPVFPFIVRGEPSLIAQLLCIYGLSFWLFAKYPLGGKSDTNTFANQRVFH